MTTNLSRHHNQYLRWLQALYIALSKFLAQSDNESNIHFQDHKFCIWYLHQLMDLWLSLPAFWQAQPVLGHHFSFLLLSLHWAVLSSFFSILFSNSNIPIFHIQNFCLRRINTETLCLIHHHNHQNHYCFCTKDLVRNGFLVSAIANLLHFHSFIRVIHR